MSDGEMYEWLADKHDEDPQYAAMTPEEYTEEMKKLADTYPWRKCIVVRIELPEV